MSIVPRSKSVGVCHACSEHLAKRPVYVVNDTCVFTVGKWVGTSRQTVASYIISHRQHTATGSTISLFIHCFMGLFVDEGMNGSSMA